MADINVSGYNPVGLTPDSFKNMQLDAGAFFIGIDSSVITPTTTAEEFALILQQAVKDNKALGATIGGGSFQAVPEVRQIEADGMRSPIIGSTVFDSWDIKLTTTLKEITNDNMKTALATAEKDLTTGALIINNTLLPEHYIPVMGWAGRILDGRLIYIEIQNALNIVGMNLTFTDKGEGTIAVEFRSHQADLTKMQYAPVKIFFFDRDGSTTLPPASSDAEKLGADKTNVLAGTYVIPLTDQTDETAMIQWVQGEVDLRINYATAVVYFDDPDFKVTLTLGSEPAVTVTITVTLET